MTDNQLVQLCRQVTDRLHRLAEAGGRTEGVVLHISPALAATRTGRLTAMMGLRVVEDATLPPGEFRLVQPLKTPPPPPPAPPAVPRR